MDVDRKIDEAIQNHELCILDGLGRRELHWRQELIDVDWSTRGRAWTLLIHLAKKAKTKQGIDECDQLGISLRDARNDLKKLLPHDLYELTSVKKGVHRLDFPPDQIWTTSLESVEQLVPLT